MAITNPAALALLVGAAVFAPDAVPTSACQGPFAITPDSGALYFTQYSAGMPAPGFFVSHRTSAGWGAPERTAFPDGAAPAPFSFSRDGERLYYTHVPDAGGRSRIWVAEREGSGWKNARPLGGALASWNSDQTSPSVTADGTLYFTSDRRGRVGGWDVYRSALRDGAYQEPELLTDDAYAGVSTVHQETGVSVAADGSFLVFSSLGGQNGMGGIDLYLAEAPGNGCRRALVTNLGPQVNTAADESDPHLSTDGKRLYFLRNGTIHEVDLAALRQAPAESYVWQHKTDLPTPRRWAQAAVMNGRIYLYDMSAPGAARQPRQPGKVESYDPATGAWATLPAVPMGWDHAKLLAVENRLLLFMPVPGSKPGIAEFDAAAQKWEIRSALDESVVRDGVPGEMRTAVIGHKIYIIHRVGNVRGFNALSEYDLDSGALTPKRAIPLPAWHYIAFRNRIYAIGGGEGNSEVSVYDPRTDEWSSMGRVPMPTWGFALAEYKDEIWLIGGHGQRSTEPLGGSLPHTISRFNPRTRTWSFGPSLPGQRVFATAAVVGERMFVLGGIGPSASYVPDLAVLEYVPGVTKSADGTIPEKSLFTSLSIDGRIYIFRREEDDISTPASGDVYSYDPATRRWKTCAKMPAAKSSYSLVQMGNKAYAIGGFTGPNTPSNSVEEYDPSTDKWTSKSGMPTARSRVTSIVLDGKIYALGGKTGESATTDAVEVYDPARDSWTKKRPLSRPLMGVSAVAINGKIYKLQGAELRNRQFIYVFDFEEYDPAADVWTKKAPWTFAREPLDLITSGGRMFVVGGGAYSGSNVQSMIEYDIARDRWVLRSTRPQASVHAIHPSWAVMDGKIYVLGGGFRQGNAWMASDRVQRYDPALDFWEELPPMAEGKIGMAVAVIGKKLFVLGGEMMGAAGQSDRSPRSDLLEVYETK